MTETYETVQYLLDRANIHDTVRKLTLYYDLHNVTGLASGVFASHVYVDYSRLTGSRAAVIDGKAWAETIGKIMDKYDSTQHVVSNIVADLGQPGLGRQRPDKVSLRAHANGYLVKNAARGGPLMQNGAIYYLELTREQELEEKGLNPWRISHHEILATGWANGNSAVHQEAFAFMKGE